MQPYSPPDLFAPDFSALYASLGSRVADLPGFGTNWGSFSNLGMLQYEERVHNAFIGFGFNTNEQLGGIPGTRLTPIYGELNPGEGTGESPDGTISVNTDWGIIGYEWASDDDWWAPSGTRQRLTDGELEKIIKDVNLILNISPNCNAFIQEVQKRMPGEENNPMDDGQGLIDVLREVHREGGIWFDSTIKNGGEAYGGEGNRVIDLLPPVPPGNSEFSTTGSRKRHVRGQELKIAKIALNEAFHHAGSTHRDEDLYSAWARWKGLPEAEKMPKAPSGRLTSEELTAYNAGIRRYVTKYSGMWHAEMDRVCFTGGIPLQ